MAGKTQDYIPRPEGVLTPFLDNVVVKLPDYSSTFEMNDIDVAVPFNSEVPAASEVLALYGRFPDFMKVRIQNTGGVALNISTNAIVDGPLQPPITNLLPSTSIDLTILGMGGQGRPFLRIENIDPVTGGGYILFTTRLGRMINAADRTIRQINITNQKRTDYGEQVEIKDAQKKVHVGLLRDEFQDMKEDNNFTSAIGDDLDIIAEQPSIDTANAKPELTSKKVPTGWSIGFNLRGFFDGITISRKRPDDPAFTFWRQRTTGKSVIDTDAMVNGTQYQAYFMIGDELVGQPSDILTISV